ncbi:MAG: hypothetical protein ACREAA_20895 [Candidatus Polarisedimenticolia bacterium]
MTRLSAFLIMGVLCAASASLVPGQPASEADDPDAMTDEQIAITPAAKTVTATVEAFDRENRTVTLRSEEGRVVTVRVPESVERFSNIRVGDKVMARYSESMTLALSKPGEMAPEPSETEEFARMPGMMPGGAVARRVNTTVTVMDVDQDRNILSVRMADGTLNSFEVQDKKNRERLQKLQAGDRINVTYNEATLLSVQPQEK